MSVLSFLDIGLALLVVLVALWTIAAQDLFASVVGYVAYGLLLALVWIRLYAPDVALTEAAVGSGVTGVLLIFSLMVTPAATAQYLSRRPATAITISVVIALAATWVGLFVAFYTPYPVSFFITGIVFGLYMLVRLVRLAIKAKK